MDDSVKKFKERRDARLKKRMDDDWITIKGTHVMVDEDKNITAGPERLKNAKSGGKVAAKKGNPFVEIDPDDKGLAEWAKKEGYKSAWSEPFYDKQGRKVMEGHFSYADKYGRTVSPSDIMEKRGKRQKG